MTPDSYVAFIVALVAVAATPGPSIVDLTWSLLASRARRLITSRRAKKVANRTSAATMAGAAVVIATR